jgi:DNA-binding IclR family transcriptional regulator
MQTGVEAMEVGGRLLQVLAANPTPLMLKALAAQADMAPAKAHRYLVSLQRLGLVEQRATDGLYAIGPLALQLGLQGLAQIDPVGLALEQLPALVQASGATVALAVWGNQGPTIIRWIDNRALVSASLRTGAVLPITRSATGRAFLAFLPGVAQGEPVKHELVANRRQGIEPGNRRQLEALASLGLKHGMGRVQGELVTGISSLAAPVRDSSAQVVLVATVLGLAGSFDARWDGDCAQALRDWCQQLEGRLGAVQRGA